MEIRLYYVSATLVVAASKANCHLIIFNDILKNSDGFSSVVSDIRQRWFKYECNNQSSLKSEFNQARKRNHEIVKNALSGNRQYITPQLLNEDFDQHVSIHELWEFYNSITNEERKQLFNMGLYHKIESIHEWLSNGEITSKQLIAMLSDQKYKAYYGNYIMAFSTEELPLRLLHYQGHVLGQKMKLVDFYYKKTTQFLKQLFEKMRVRDKEPFEVAVTERHICVTFKNTVQYQSIQAILTQDSHSILDSLVFNQNDLTLSIDRKKSDACLKYVRKTIENTDDETCQKILAKFKEEETNELEPSSDSKSIGHQIKEIHKTDLIDENDNEINNKSDISLNSSNKQLIEQHSPSKFDFIKHFLKANKTSLSVISMASGVGFFSYGVYQCITTFSGIEDIKFFDTNTIVAMIGVILFMIGVGMACNCSKKPYVENDVKQVSNMNNR